MKSENGYYSVTFLYDEEVWCTNLAKAEAVEDVKAKYSKYAKVEIRPAADYEIDTAKMKRMPIINCPHIEPEPEPERKEEATMKINQRTIPELKKTFRTNATSAPVIISRLPLIADEVEERILIVNPFHIATWYDMDGNLIGREEATPELIRKYAAALDGEVIEEEPKPEEPEQTQQPDPDKLADIRSYFESCRAYWTRNGATPAAATSRALWWDCCEVWNADKSWTPEKIEFINQYRQYKPYGPIPEEERVATGNA